MKCEELEFERLGDANKTYPASTLVIQKQFVDAAIDELKQKIHNAEMAKDDAEAANTEYRADIAALKADNDRLNRELVHVKNGDCILTCDVVEKHVKEELKAKRALWMARALALSRFDVDKYIRTHMMSNYWKRGYEIFVLACMAMQNKIDKTKEILLKKAEEYK